jgi:hypothetical protein
VDQGDELPLRRKKRYNHVQINLMVKTGDQWKRIKAADWNEWGFNFILDQDLTEKIALFKKGAAHFSGEIVWTHKKTDEALHMEMVLNALILNRLKLLAQDKEMARRIIRLIRTPGRIDEKQKLLRIADPSLRTDADLEALWQKERSGHLLYRYGIKTASSEWKEIIEYTLETTDVVLQLGKMEEGLSGLSR